MHTKKRTLHIMVSVFAALVCALCIMLSAEAPKAQALVHNPRFANCKKIYGIDVSKWQTDIDWKKVKADGVDFVIIRLGYSDRQTGVHCLDEKFKQNYLGAREAGLKIGVYYYSTAITKAEAVSEANYVLKVLGTTRLDLPVYFDQECSEGRVKPGSITTWSMTQFALSFLDTISAGGYDAGYYSYVSWIQGEIDASSIEKKYPMWIANVTNETKYQGLYHMWQYSFTGRVNGIPTAVDRDVLYVNEAPAKVTGVKATVNGSTATISWSKVSGADGYRIYKKTGSTVELAGEVGADKLSYTVEASPVSASYYVCAYTDGIVDAESDPSLSVTVKSDVPYNLSSKNALTSITLSWEPLNGAAGYVVYYDFGSGKYSKAGTTTGTSLKIKGLTEDTKYNFAVKAYFNADGSKAYTEGVSTLSAASSTHHTGTQNVMATGLKLQKPGATTQTLTWKAPSGKVNGYRVYFYDKETGNYKRAAQVTTNTATISGLTPGAEYSYMVRSYYNTEDTMVLSQYSDILTVYTQATKVTDIKTTKRTEDSLTLAWKMGSQGEAEAYRVYSYDAAAKKYTRLTQTNKTSFKVTGLTAGKAYTFLVRSLYKAESGETILSEYSDLCTTGTMAKKATALKVKTNSDKSQTISWKIPADQTVDGSRLYAYDTSTKKYTKLCDVKTNSFKVTGLKANTVYHYLVRTYYKAGNDTILSTYSALLDCATSAKAPEDFKASSITSTSCKLSWKKISGVTGYSIYRVDGDGNLTIVKSVKTNSAVIEGLKSGKSITYVVRAYRNVNGIKYLGYTSAKVKVTAK